MEGMGGRTAYNMSIQLTNAQQMLLNLVRLRYVDTPLFLDVSSVTTQFTYKTRLSPTIPIPGFNEENPFILGGEVMSQDQPTITYTPLEGQTFSARMLRPIDLGTIQQLVYSGWEIDRVFRMMVQNFDDLYNAPEAASPQPDLVPRFYQFKEAVEILRFYQKRGELQLGVKVDPKSIDPKDGEGAREISLQLCIPQEERSMRLLELVPSAKKLDGRIGIEMDLGFNQRGKIGLMPRSILSCMYYLSQSIEVPDAHIECGFTRLAHTEEHAPKDWCESMKELLTIHSSYLPPKNAYAAVKYRKYWYYIDDCDLTSKKTFALLLQLYNLHAEERRTLGPILTLPLG